MALYVHMALTDRKSGTDESDDDTTRTVQTPGGPVHAAARAIGMTGGRHADTAQDDGIGRHLVSPDGVGRHADGAADDHEPEHLLTEEPVQHWYHRVFTPYALAVMLSLLSLSPFIVLTTATSSLTDLMGSELHTTPTVLEVSSGLANAGYAFGAVLAAFLAQRYIQRHLFLGYEAIFIAASVLAALSPNVAVYIVGHIFQGAATGLLLVSALPPLILRFPPSRLPLTVAFVNIGLFGATALGPFLGDLFADLGTWRWLFVGVAALGVLGLISGWFGYEIFPPMNPDLPLDKPAFPLAIGATFLPFLGSGLAMGTGFASPWFWAPIAVGIVCLLGLIVHEYRRRNEPLMPVRALSSSLPVAGTVGAMLGGGAFVAGLSLVSLAMEQRGIGLLTAGTYLLPLVLGVAASSVAFKKLVTHVTLPLLAGSGLLAVVGGIAVALPITFANGPEWTVPIAAVLLGFGAGSSVAPALFLAGMGVEAQKIGRAFALIELLRSEAAFLIAPVLAVLATHIGGLAGLRETLIISLILAAAGLVLGVVIYVGSGTRPHAPRIDDWLNNNVPALHSPRVLARLRGLSTD